MVVALLLSSPLPFLFFWFVVRCLLDVTWEVGVRCLDSGCPCCHWLVAWGFAGRVGCLVALVLQAGLVGCVNFAGWVGSCCAFHGSVDRDGNTLLLGRDSTNKVSKGVSPLIACWLFGC